MRIETETAAVPRKKSRVVQPLVKSGLWDGWGESDNDSSGAADEVEPKTPLMILDEYLSETRLPVKENPLLWWKQNTSRYPQLAKLARKYLCPPPGNTSSESAFSYAGSISSKERSGLLPENVEKLFLRCNLRAINFDLSLL